MRKGEQMEKTRCDKHNKYKEIKRKMETDEETWTDVKDKEDERQTVQAPDR